MTWLGWLHCRLLIFFATFDLLGAFARNFSALKTFHAKARSETKAAKEDCCGKRSSMTRKEIYHERNRLFRLFFLGNVAALLDYFQS